MAYFPNGTAGDAFAEECADCPLGEEPCPIAAVQLAYNYDACNVPEASTIRHDLVADSGKCSMRPLLAELVKRRWQDPAQAWREEQIAALEAGRKPRG